MTWLSTFDTVYNAVVKVFRAVLHFTYFQLRHFDLKWLRCQHVANNIAWLGRRQRVTTTSIALECFAARGQLTSVHDRKFWKQEK